MKLRMRTIRSCKHTDPDEGYRYPAGAYYACPRCGSRLTGSRLSPLAIALIAGFVALTILAWSRYGDMVGEGTRPWIVRWRSSPHMEKRRHAVAFVVPSPTPPRSPPPAFA